MLKHHLNKYNNFHYNKFYLKKDHFKNYKIQTKYSNSKVKSKKYIIQNIKTYIKKQPFLKIKKVLQKRCISILQRKKTSVLPKKVRLKKIVKQKKIYKSIKKKLQNYALKKINLNLNINLKGQNGGNAGGSFFIGNTNVLVKKTLFFLNLEKNLIIVLNFLEKKKTIA